MNTKQLTTAERIRRRRIARKAYAMFIKNSANLNPESVKKANDYCIAQR